MIKPGVDLDALVFQRVMGRTVRQGTVTFPSFTTPDDPPPYSTSMDSAWQVVEKLNRYKIDFTRESEWVNDGKNPPDQLPEDTGHNVYYKWKYGVILYTIFVSDRITVFSFEGMPHAICLAALKAVGVDIENPKR